MFRSYLRLLLFTLGLLLGVQVPGFIDDYAKRVDAHRLEAAQNIQGFQQTAGQFFNGSLEELVRHYRSNSDPVFQRDGENLDRLMRRAHARRRVAGHAGSLVRPRLAHAARTEP